MYVTPALTHTRFPSPQVIKISTRDNHRSPHMTTQHASQRQPLLHTERVQMRSILQARFHIDEYSTSINMFSKRPASKSANKVGYLSPQVGLRYDSCPILDDSFSKNNSDLSFRSPARRSQGWRQHVLAFAFGASHVHTTFLREISLATLAIVLGHFANLFRHSLRVERERGVSNATQRRFVDE